jgi:hypothetical protein
MAAKAGIPPVLFALITDFAQGLQVADVVAAALGKGDDVINLKLHLGGRFATTAAAEAIPLEDILPHRWWDRDPLARFFSLSSTTHLYCENYLVRSLEMGYRE